MTFTPSHALSAAKLCLSAYGEPDATHAPNIRRANAQALVFTTPLRRHCRDKRPAGRQARRRLRP